MEEKDKKIAKMVKENYHMPESIHQKIEDSFEKIRNQTHASQTSKTSMEVKYHMNKWNIFYRVATFLIVLFLGGNAIALAFGENNIYSMIYRFFEPNEEEKIDHVIVEGEVEQVDYSGVESSLGYVIQYDEEAFRLERIGDKDFYRVKIPEISETVYFVIYHIDTAFADLKEEGIEETTIGNRQAYMTELIDGNEYNENTDYSWNSNVIDTWYIDGDKGTFVVEIHYFMEAAEGWGVRIREMLNSFRMVEQ